MMQFHLKKPETDNWVLVAAWAITAMIRIGLIFALIGAAVGFVASLFRLLAGLLFNVSENGGVPSTTDQAIIVAILFLSVAALGQINGFFGRLASIIATVGKGDPFIPANADRLYRMAWQALVAQFLAIVLAMLGSRVGQDVAPSIIRALFGFWLGGLALSLGLFVLARVFRRGAEMRAEIEGTV